MSLLNILHYPDSRLRTTAIPVKAVDDSIRQLVKDMFETMYEAPGIGLAATQVDIHKRVIVIDVSENRDTPRHFINPEIIEQSGTEECEEGCLSVPDIFETVQRAEIVRVRALNENGETFEEEADGMLAVCIQHEMDHLVGKMFVDYLSPLKQQRIRKKLQKSQRLSAGV